MLILRCLLLRPMSLRGGSFTTGMGTEDGTAGGNGSGSTSASNMASGFDLHFVTMAAFVCDMGGLLLLT